jgi:hypothetical protein
MQKLYDYLHDFLYTDCLDNDIISYWRPCAHFCSLHRIFSIPTSVLHDLQQPFRRHSGGSGCSGRLADIKLGDCASHNGYSEQCHYHVAVWKPEGRSVIPGGQQRDHDDHPIRHDCQLYPPGCPMLRILWFLLLRRQLVHCSECCFYRVRPASILGCQCLLLGISCC